MPNTTDSPEKLKLRVAAYFRVSTDTDEQPESLETQIKHYESFILANPEWKYAGIYADDGATEVVKDFNSGKLTLGVG